MPLAVVIGARAHHPGGPGAAVKGIYDVTTHQVEGDVVGLPHGVRHVEQHAVRGRRLKLQREIISENKVSHGVRGGREWSCFHYITIQHATRSYLEDYRLLVERLA